METKLASSNLKRLKSLVFATRRGRLKETGEEVNHFNSILPRNTTNVILK